ncbi:2-(3-amino-3-carboxypropyl)histidine synthase subunit 2 [Hemicordylus capensis]|uniref:2-(3-amino-3-carboxypropyl)histidine synthase subunit 2 n=1 Tax=Hemicordylus capensis TaxID=884348 RepID=UPI002302E6DE|nr:2-(3-amino-3-carboxypropyl)histidine synthase subunit 2 [Hemicordylus capensis]XP_053106898.1 2-(3-amino-3-carboxypropyl)histidine synthase subunit 2 [Hemicordylus capensis]
MATPFSSDGAEVMQRGVIPAGAGSRPPTIEADEFYELKRATAFVSDNGFTKVALQFPDELLSDSAVVAARMEEATGAKMYILGDTSYGSCCVDEVAAEHVGAEAVVHYGPACLSPCRKLPVLHVFGRQPLDVMRCAEVFRELHPDFQAHVVVLSDVAYSHAIDNLATQLQSIYPNVVFSQLDNKEALDLAQPVSGLVQQFGRHFAVDKQHGLENYTMFYVGCEGRELTNFMLSWNQCSFSSFDPRTGQGRWETLDVNRALRRRLYLVERARDAQVVGIVVGTLGVADYLSVLDHLRGVIHRAGKRAYTLAVGKPNPAKLANFLEIEIFVLVACPQNSLLDSADFYRPLVTPYEMEMACNPARAWTGSYITDFRNLLPGACEHIPFPSKVSEADSEPDISLITGELRSVCLSPAPNPEPTSSTAVTCRSHSHAIAEISPAASFLESRSWQGLEQQLGQTPVTKAVAGRRGIAIAYEDEPCA